MWEVDSFCELKVANIIFVSFINKVHVMHLWSFKMKLSILLIEIDSNEYFCLIIYEVSIRGKRSCDIYRKIMQEIKVRRF
jgi:hypothetical protein